MDNTRVFIIVNGDLDNKSYYRRLIKRNDLVIAVNGGSMHALAIGVVPDIVIGDLDSIAEEIREEILSRASEVITYPVAKDKTDLELALEKAVAFKPVEIVIIGALRGERLDHQIGNILLLKVPLSSGIEAAIINESEEVRMFNCSFNLSGQPGDILSLFALSETVSGIKTEGLLYPLDDESLCFSSSRGVSNEFITENIRVEFSSGTLLAVKTRR